MRLWSLVLWIALGCVACGPAKVPQPPIGRTMCLPPGPISSDKNHPQGMIQLPGGVFSMGARPERAEEGPPHPVRVEGFWIDRTDVTNADFARFVAATGYRTVAERPLDPSRFPGLSPDQRRPAALVFVGATGNVNLSDPSQWWRVVPGADWRHPYGPGSTIDGRGALPVVQVAWEDAIAYARWLGHDLPTEAEWEYAARGGLQNQTYAWGDEPPGVAQAGARPPRANTWQGVFPAADTGRDGFKASPSPVGCYPPNGYGLHDMAGNVWQWTLDVYNSTAPAAAAVEEGGVPASTRSSDRRLPRHVIKGGSYLCSDDFCYRYRPAARTDGPPDGGATHIGFRTVWRPGRR